MKTLVLLSIYSFSDFTVFINSVDLSTLDRTALTFHLDTSRTFLSLCNSGFTQEVSRGELLSSLNFTLCDNIEQLAWIENGQEIIVGRNFAAKTNEYRADDEPLELWFAHHLSTVPDKTPIFVMFKA